MSAGALTYKPLPVLPPPPPKTNYSHAKCYLSETADCDDKRTGEHYISDAVLREIGNKIEISGMPWLDPGERRTVGIGALTANVLCRRHNSALSPLDTVAAEFFAALKEIDANFAKRSLSRKGLKFSISGEALELWMLKATCGICLSFGEIDGAKIVRDYVFELAKVIRAFFERNWDANAGLHLLLTAAPVEAHNRVSVSPAFNNKEKRAVGMRLNIRGLQFDLVFDMTRLDPLSPAGG
jgi:hypothetical protein